MDQFGIQQCEREEGDGSSSAFTLVLPKDNQGRSRYISYCVKKLELSYPRRVKVDPGITRPGVNCAEVCNPQATTGTG